MLCVAGVHAFELSPHPDHRGASVGRVVARLWEHSCCEIFIAAEGASPYHELNFSFSGEWAAYAFSGYRDGARPVGEALDPRIRLLRTGSSLALHASINLGLLRYERAKLLIGLSVVVEDEGGALSYWALRHPPGKPDFHHPAAFALALDEARD